MTNVWSHYIAHFGVDAEGNVPDEQASASIVVATASTTAATAAAAAAAVTAAVTTSGGTAAASRHFSRRLSKFLVFVAFLVRWATFSCTAF